MKKYVLILLLITLSFSTVDAQKIKWQKKEKSSEVDLYLFHSTQMVNFPTAEIIGKGGFEFEISHRFRAPVNTGFENFYGLDAGANMRIALGYAFTNDLMVTLARSDVDKNFDMQAKYRLFEFKNDVLPAIVAMRGGIAWNTQEIFGRDRSDSKNFQYYFQLILNTMYANKLGIGVVPSYLYNSHIRCIDTEDTFTLGIYMQYYIGKLWGVFIEWNPTVTGWRQHYNSVTTGIELETGGHFFKLFLSNNTNLNPSQYLAGADYKFSEGDLVFGFNITRLLQF